VSAEPRPTEEAVRRSEALLRSLLYRSGSGVAWLAKVSWKDRKDVEISLAGGPEGPSADRVRHAAICLASLDALVPLP
jgi:hypothetical protein